MKWFIAIQVNCNKHTFALLKQGNVLRDWLALMWADSHHHLGICSPPQLWLPPWGCSLWWSGEWCCLSQCEAESQLQPPFTCNLTWGFQQRSKVYGGICVLNCCGKFFCGACLAKSIKNWTHRTENLILCFCWNVPCFWVWWIHGIKEIRRFKD